MTDIMKTNFVNALRSLQDVKFRCLEGDGQKTVRLLCRRFERLCGYGIDPELAFVSIIVDWMARSTDTLADESQLPLFWPVSERSMLRITEEISQIRAVQSHDYTG